VLRCERGAPYNRRAEIGRSQGGIGHGRARVGFVIGPVGEPKGSGMEIDRSDDEGVAVITVRGVINFGESARQFSSYLQDLLKSGVPAVLVDMSGIDNVDSTGLGELVGYLQRFEKEGRRMALLRPLPGLRGSGRGHRRTQPLISYRHPNGSSRTPV
jgi:anti-anti-sigma factor